MRSLRDDFGINPWRWKDPQAGAGVWGWAGKQVWPAAVSSAVEVRAEEAEHLPFNYDTFWIEDYLEAPLRVDSEDLIATNPSFEDAMPVADKALRELRDGGHLVLLLRLTWRRGGGRLNSRGDIVYERYIKTHRLPDTDRTWMRVAGQPVRPGTEYLYQEIV